MRAPFEIANGRLESICRVAVPMISAGILLFRTRSSLTEVFLVHPGGPYWSGKDLGAWSVPKGIVGRHEDDFAAARREFHEETGFDMSGIESAQDLGAFALSRSKTLRVWAIEGDCEPSDLTSNSFEMEWPPGSGHRRQFPEIDRGEWFDQPRALERITKGQRPVIEAFYSGR
jgi:predicted NUDIX family NTP pyrophosphohydrolase